jgi:predicted RNA-binding Zn-ribbon protein involved in translation (DUF1610 family)
MVSPKFSPELIAPCGMNCGICRAYNAYIHGVPTKRGKVTHCTGCRPRAKNCYVIRACPKLRKNQIHSCSECDIMPCDKLSHLDKRYRKHYNMSMVENIKTIKAKGMTEFLAEQAENYRCPNCGEVVCVHDRKCYLCRYIRKNPERESIKKAKQLSTKKE